MTNWIQTLPYRGEKVGNAFDLVNPTSDMVGLETIATVLARVPRFGGHTEKVLSVAQHCSEGARAIIRDTGRRDWAAAFLLHDAHEAYIGDLTSPLVRALSAMADNTGHGYPGICAIKYTIAEMKSRIDAAIYIAAGLQYPLSPACAAVVKQYDVRMLRTERDARMAPPPAPWVQPVEDAEPIAGVDLFAWSEGSARLHFWHMCCELIPVCKARESVSVSPDFGNPVPAIVPNQAFVVDSKHTVCIVRFEAGAPQL